MPFLRLKKHGIKVNLRLRSLLKELQCTQQLCSWTYNGEHSVLNTVVLKGVSRLSEQSSSTSVQGEAWH